MHVTSLLIVGSLEGDAGMNACIGVGQLEEARDLLENMRERGLAVDARAFNVVLKGYARRGDVQKMRDMLEEMQRCGVEPSIASYNTLINVYVRRGDMAEVSQCCGNPKDVQTAKDVQRRRSGCPRQQFLM